MTSFAGFTYQDRLSVGFYGEVYRARSATGQEVRVLEVDPHLAEQPGFTDALARHGALLGMLEHPNAASTLSVGRRAKGPLVVVTETIRGPVSLEELLSDAGEPRKVPAEIAMALAGGILDALAAAHALRLVHGALHPRSVFVDWSGTIKIGHFAAGRALAAAAALDPDAKLLQGLTGYVAPELALGEQPTTGSDVYALGALVFTMLTGELPPGSLQTTPAVERVVQRALDTDSDRRHMDAGELQADLLEALDDDGWRRASLTEVAEWVNRWRADTDAHLDAATEDLLSVLGEPAEKPASPGKGGAALDLDAAMAALDDEESGSVDIGFDSAPIVVGAADDEGAGEDELLEEATEVAPEPGDGAAEAGGDDDEPTSVAPEVAGGAEDVLAQLEADPPTHVDRGPPELAVGRDPISEIIELEKKGRSLRLDSDDDEDHTPLPAPRPDDWDAASMVDGYQVARGRGGTDHAAAAAAAIADLDDEPETEPDDGFGDGANEPGPAAVPAREPPAAVLMRPISEPTLVVAPRGLGTGIWLLTSLLLLGTLGAVLYVRTDLFHPERARQKREAREAALEAERRRLEAQLPQPGAVIVASNEDGAAVWLLLGRTPTETMPLPAERRHYVRLEYDGYRPLDLTVGPEAWSGVGPDSRAEVAGELAPAGRAAVSAAPAVDVAPTGREGRGTVRVLSTPEGAQAWLLVGFTPGMALQGIEAGRGYELKVVKDGYRPGFVVVKPEDWWLGASADAGLVGEIRRRVELVPR